MQTSNSFIIVKNIPNSVNSSLVENGLRTILNRQRQRFGSPILIRVFPSLISQTAFIFYLTSNFNAEIVQFFDNELAFGSNLNFRLAVRRYAHPAETTRGLGLAHTQNRSNNENNLISNRNEISGLEENNTLHSRRVLVDLDADIPDFFITGTVDSTNNNFITPNSVNNLNENDSVLAEEGIPAQPTNSSTDNNLVGVEEVIRDQPSNLIENILLEAEGVISNSNPHSSASNPISHVRFTQEINSIFRCSRCEYNFEQNQERFENHVEQCRDKEEQSLSNSIRNNICVLCYGRFLQTPVTGMHFLSCGHLFHKVCFEEKIKDKSKKCPICDLEYLSNCRGNFFL